jgi:hypothetical protein
MVVRLVLDTPETPVGSPKNLEILKARAALHLADRAGAPAWLS